MSAVSRYKSARNVLDDNRVLRNTFLLLAFSLIPTIFGAVFAESSGFNAWSLAHPWTALIATLLGAFILIGLVMVTAESGVGVVILLGFTWLMGMVMSAGIVHTLALKNGHLIVAEAIIGTITITIFCAIYAMTTKRDFSSIGGLLFGLLLAIIAMMILNAAFFHLTALQMAISVIALVLFSVYLVYDVQRVISGGEDNYVRATLAIYLDIVNIFANLLSLLSGDD